MPWVGDYMPHMLGIAPSTVRLLPQVFTAKGVCHPHVLAQCGLLAGLEFVAGGEKIWSTIFAVWSCTITHV